jgi:STE24 endopeptidase
MLLALACALCALTWLSPAAADIASPAVDLPGIPAAAAAVPLDVDAATRAYLDTVPPAARASSDAYFENGYWLQLWDFLLGSAIGIGLLHTGLSARMRTVASRVTRSRFVHVALYWAFYLLATTLLGSPLHVYEGFFREHAYGLSNMSFGAWLGDEVKGLAAGLVLGALAVPLLYAILRRAKKTWWVWGSVAMIGFAAFVVAIVPVFLAPLFNKYTPLTDESVRGPVLALARANGIGAHDVFEFDASRQSKRVSANVSGLGGTERISLNDNLLTRCSLPEIEAVMGHEMGHYVLHHVWKLLLELGLVILLGFLFVRFGFDRLRARYADRWKVEGIDDPAGLPLVALLFGVFALAATPVVNTIVRTSEAEADLFGLNASREPDGMATVALKLGEYRKLDPAPLEEILFFDHPSGRHRIEMAMRWKAEHVGDSPLP